MDLEHCLVSAIGVLVLSGDLTTSQPLLSYLQGSVSRRAACPSSTGELLDAPDHQADYDGSLAPL